MSIVVAKKRDRRWPSAVGVIGVKLAENLVVARVATTDTQPFVDDEDDAMRAHNTAAEVDFEQRAMVTNFAERQGIAQNETLAYEGLHMVFVNYLIAFIRVPVADPAALAALSFVSTR